MSGGRTSEWVARVLHVEAWKWPSRRTADNADADAAIKRAVEDFTTALLHELRTPLAALSAEVEIALRRDRSPAAYREALTRIAEQATELVNLTRDFAVLAESASSRSLPSPTSDLQRLLSQLAARYEPTEVQIVSPPVALHVAGDEALLARALQVLLEHIVRSRASSSVVRLQIAAPSRDTQQAMVELLVSATAPGLSRQSWLALTELATVGARVGDGHGRIRLHTACTIVALAGGCVSVTDDGGAIGLRIALRRATPDSNRREAASSA